MPFKLFIAVILNALLNKIRFPNTFPFMTCSDEKQLKNFL